MNVQAKIKTKKKIHRNCDSKENFRTKKWKKINSNTILLKISRGYLDKIFEHLRRSMYHINSKYWDRQALENSVYPNQTLQYVAFEQSM